MSTENSTKRPRLRDFGRSPPHRAAQHRAGVIAYRTRGWRRVTLMAVATLKAIAYEVDDGRWPLVVMRATTAVRDDAALDATYRALEAQLAKGECFILLIDARRGFSSPQRRKRLAAWGERNASQIGATVVALAVVVGNEVERGFVTAALWHRSPPYPLRVFSAPEEAETWLMGEYQERNAADSRPPEA